MFHLVHEAVRRHVSATVGRPAGHAEPDGLLGAALPTPEPLAVRQAGEHRPRPPAQLVQVRTLHPPALLGLCNQC